MIFKEEKLQAELHSRHTLLQQMAADFESLSRSFGIEPVVTRILERVVGSSGVHEDGRGIDFRDEHPKGVFLYTSDQVRFLLSKINAKYRRTDNFLTLIHHSFSGGMTHFHLQLAPSMSVYKVVDPATEEVTNPSNPLRVLRELHFPVIAILHAPCALTVLKRNAIQFLLCLATFLLTAYSMSSHPLF